MLPGLSENHERYQSPTAHIWGSAHASVRIGPVKKREALKPYVNVGTDLSMLRDAVSADLDLVSDAYAATQTTLLELEKALTRIGSIAAQEGSGAAVKAFREIAAAQKDIASTLIALRAEGRLTIRERMAKATEADPPKPAEMVGDAVHSTAAIFSLPRAELDLPTSPDNDDSGIDSDSSPDENTNNPSQ